MTNEQFVEFLNIHLAQCEAAGTFPAEIIADLRAACSDPDRVAELVEKYNSIIDVCLCHTGLQVAAERPTPLCRPDEFDGLGNRVFLTGGPVIHDCGFVRIKKSEQ